MRLRELSIDDIESLAVGAWVLGTGGGGNPYLPLLNMRALYKDGHKVQLMESADLEDDDWVVIDAHGARIFHGDREVQREIRLSGISGAMMGKGNHKHFMLKEIYEQPAVVGDTLQSYTDPASRTVHLPKLPFD